MKIIPFLLLLSFFATAQKNNIGIYGNAYAALMKPNSGISPSPAAGLIAGAEYKGIGLGGGAETFVLLKGNSMAYPLFADVRYTFRNRFSAGKPRALPYLAVDLGGLLWRTSETQGSPIDNFTNTYKGRSYFSAEAGAIFLKNRKHGLYAALSFRSYSADRYGVHRTTLSNAGTMIPLVETKSGPSRDIFHAFAVKAGFSL